MQRALHGVRLLLVAVWLGAAVFFSFAVAPSAFAVLPSRELAGALVARTLAILNVGGAAVGLVLLISAFVGRKGARLVALLAELLALAAMTGAAFVGHFVIASRMAALRAQMGKPIEEMAGTMPCASPSTRCTAVRDDDVIAIAPPWSRCSHRAPDGEVV